MMTQRFSFGSAAEVLDDDADEEGDGVEVGFMVEGQPPEDHPLCQSGAELGVHLMSDTYWEWCWDAEGSQSSLPRATI